MFVDCNGGCWEVPAAICAVTIDKRCAAETEDLRYSQVVPSKFEALYCDDRLEHTEILGLDHLKKAIWLRFVSSTLIEVEPRGIHVSVVGAPNFEQCD